MQRIDTALRLKVTILYDILWEYIDYDSVRKRLCDVKIYMR